LAGAGRGLCGVFEPGDVNAGLGFGDGAVVDLDLGGLALDEEALDGFAAGGERGCTGQQFENATSGNCYHLTAGAAFLCSTKMCA